MNDYREVGDLSVQVMLVPEGKREPYPRHYSGTFAFSRFLYPLAHGLPLRVAVPGITRCFACGTWWGLPSFLSVTETT